MTPTQIKTQPIAEGCIFFLDYCLQTYMWAEEELESMLIDDPETGFACFMQIIEKISNDSISRLGIQHFRKLLEAASHQLFLRIIIEVENSEKLRLALAYALS